MLEIVVGYDKNGLIGKGDILPWHIPEDLKHFKELTSGHRIIMGRVTYEGIGRLLPNRENIILTRKEAYKVEGAKIASTLEELNHILDDTKRNFVIGGSTVYKELLPYVDMLHISHIDGEYEGDVYFPSVNWQEFDKVEEKRYDKFVYCVYKRKKI